MNVEEIVFGDRFLKYFEKLTTKVKQQFFLKLELFEQNPFHPSLRLHKLTGGLEGLWSISLDKSHRVIFEVLEEGIIKLIVVGNHSIYKKRSRKYSK